VLDVAQRGQVRERAGAEQEDVGALARLDRAEIVSPEGFGGARRGLRS